MPIDNFSAQPELQDNMAIVQCEDRWQVYHRLKELNIPCRCQAHQPLRVEVTSAQSAIQIWSVARQISNPRQDLVQWLKHYWRIQAGNPSSCLLTSIAILTWLNTSPEGWVWGVRFGV